MELIKILFWKSFCFCSPGLKIVLIYNNEKTFFYVTSENTRAERLLFSNQGTVFPFEELHSLPHEVRWINDRWISLECDKSKTITWMTMVCRKWWRGFIADDYPTQLLQCLFFIILLSLKLQTVRQSNPCWVYIYALLPKTIQGSVGKRCVGEQGGKSNPFCSFIGILLSFKEY